MKLHKPFQNCSDVRVPNHPVNTFRPLYHVYLVADKTQLQGKMECFNYIDDQLERLQDALNDLQIDHHNVLAFSIAAT